nr:LuxR C-terminal-related transcriptional regulator [Archangium primigenium]
MSNQDIATALAIKEGTVKDHVEASFKRLGVTSGRTGLLALARRS